MAHFRRCSFHHVLVFSEPVAIRIGLGVVALLGLIIWVAGFSPGVAQTARVHLGGSAAYG